MEVYKKPALTFEEQVNLLKSRGLEIESDIIAIAELKSISYYRLSGYMYPFLADTDKHIFKKGTKFEDVLGHYNFDRHLRLLILDAIERIEVAFRAQLIYHFSHDYGAWWFEKSGLFGDEKEYKVQLDKIQESLRNSDEIFIEHYKNKYTPATPPAWMVMEVVSFNQLSRWYKNLINKDTKKKIALYFDCNYIELESWLHAIVYTRNICAHHSRLWNRRFLISPKFPQKPPKDFINIERVTNSRLYFTLSIILHFLNTMNPDCGIRKKIVEFFLQDTVMDKTAMGFPIEWEKEFLWTINH